MHNAMRACAAVAALSVHWCAAAKPAIPIEWKASGVVTTVLPASAGSALEGALPGDRLVFHARFDAVGFRSESSRAGPGALADTMTYRLTHEAPVATVSLTRGDEVIAIYAAAEMRATVRNSAEEETGLRRDSVEFRITIDPLSLHGGLGEGGPTLDLSIIAVGPDTLFDSSGFPLMMRFEEFTSVEFAFIEDGENIEEAVSIVRGVIENWSWAIVPAPGTLTLALIAMPCSLRRRR